MTEMPLMTGCCSNSRHLAFIILRGFHRPVKDHVFLFIYLFKIFFLLWQWVCTYLMDGQDYLEKKKEGIECVKTFFFFLIGLKDVLSLRH